MKRQIWGLLAVDIGNSTIGLGYYPDAVKGKPFVVDNILWKTPSALKLSRHIKNFLRGDAADHRNIGVVISSVVPAMNRRIISAVSGFCRDPLIVDYRLAGGLSLGVSHPESIGTDRVVNSLAALSRFGRPLAVADFGTATTISVVGKQADFLGGAILPGIDMMKDSLASGTAKLPIIRLAAPHSALGRDTASAIESGIIHGSAGAVVNITRRLEKELGYKLLLVITGGRAGLAAPFVDIKHVLAPNLIFDGMRLIYLKHAGHRGDNCVY